ncbi:hypothetical protein [Chitinimonas naiadis]
MASFTAISKERFNAICYCRAPTLKLFTEEIEWFELEQEGIRLVAAVALCKIDKDYNAIILGRDARRLYRAIHVIVSKASVAEVLAAMTEQVAALIASHVDGVFPQGDEEIGPFYLLRQKVHSDKFNRYFQMLNNDPMYHPAKVMLEELAYSYTDPDGVFIRHFQSNDFNARLLELYLHAVFYELDFTADRQHPQPDFLISKWGNTIAVEAVSVAQIDPDEAPVALTAAVAEELDRHAMEDMPFRFHRALLKKMRHKPEPANKHYWELAHTVGHPFVLAIQDYSRKMSMTISGEALQRYLYGFTVDQEGCLQRAESHTVGNRSIPVGFFRNPQNRHVAAVMLARGATLPKFNRMGRMAGLISPTSFAVLEGLRTNGKGEYEEFVSIVDHPGHKESWHESLVIFHNPLADNPLNMDLFPHVIHVRGEEDGFSEYIPSNFIVSSATRMYRVTEDMAIELRQKWHESPANPAAASFTDQADPGPPAPT